MDAGGGEPPRLAAVRGGERITVFLFLALLGLFSGPAVESALAAGPEPALVLRECFADFRAGPCQAAPHPSLELAADVAVSPEGRSVYVAAMHRELPALGSNAITEFTREADGKLRPTGCLTFAGGRGCRAARIPLEGVRRLVVTPDGRDVYALADDGIAEFARAAGGRLRPIGCLAFDTEGRGTARCKHPEGGFETDMIGLAISPDGADLYVTAGNYVARSATDKFVSRLFEFARRPDGTLATIGCLGPAGRSRCAKIGTSELRAPVVTADGRALYAVDDESLLRFPRSEDGRLGRPECVLGRRAGCAQTQGAPAPSYYSVALSADGSRLYLGTTQVTVAYSVSPDGTLTKLASRKVPSYTLALAPDGSRLYGADSTGVNTFVTAEGTLSPSGAEYPMEGAEGIAVTTDGSALLVPSWWDSTLLVLTPNPKVSAAAARPGPAGDPAAS
jgi:DNA-binding beta-propeller fold protein YncE